jgi:phospholipid/cholesterol/gamma-HCH transport system substrate-binding protein
MKREIRVGIFVTVALLLVSMTVFLIGDNRHLWQSKVKFDAAFQDVSGIKPGSPVRMGGVDIGTVERVGQSSDPADPLVYVGFTVLGSMKNRIRVNTVAKISNKGLLGDKMLELTVGDGDPLPPGSRVKSEEPSDLSKYLAKFDAISGKAEKAVDNIEKATRPFSDPKFSDDVTSTVASLREILDGVAHKDTAIHRVLMDPTEGPKIDRLLNELSAAAGQLDAALSNVREVTEQVKTGPGIAHAVLYDGEMSKNAAGTVAELREDLRAVREGNGLGHALIYGDDDTQRLKSNVVGMTDDLRKIVGDMRQGKGTLGGLLVDPTIYEDIKGLVGNMQRNQVLRALVRYSIKESKEGAPEPKQ